MLHISGYQLHLREMVKMNGEYIVLRPLILEYSVSTDRCFVMRHNINMFHECIFNALTQQSGQLNQPWCHDDVIEWKHFPRNWPFVRGIHRSRNSCLVFAKSIALWILPLYSMKWNVSLNSNHTLLQREIGWIKVKIGTQYITNTNELYAVQSYAEGRQYEYIHRVTHEMQYICRIIAWGPFY